MATVIITVVMVVFIVVVPAARMISPALPIVVPMIMRVISIGVGRTIPAPADPAIVISVRRPITTNPISTWVRLRAAYFIPYRRWRRPNVNANLRNRRRCETS
jgi:hypothetical protein